MNASVIRQFNTTLSKRRRLAVKRDARRKREQKEGVHADLGNRRCFNALVFVHYVVLAAGESRRMGFDKAVRRRGAPAPLERLARALGDRPVVLVVPTRLRLVAAEMMPRAIVALNDEPQRGMTHSLRVGLRFVPASSSFGVLLGDMPAMTEETMSRTELLMQGNTDVAYPVNAAGTPGHPVLFSPRARCVVESLADGDTLRHARDDASLVRATWICTDASAFLDLDDPAQWEAFHA